MIISRTSQKSDGTTECCQQHHLDDRVCGGNTTEVVKDATPARRLSAEIAAQVVRARWTVLLQDFDGISTSVLFGSGVLPP